MDQGSFAAPHGLSQLVASFIGSQCQGILLALFFCLTSLGSLKNYCGNLLLGLLYLHTLCQNRKTFKLIFVHLNVFSIVAFFFPLFSFQCAFFFFGVGLRPPPDYPLAYGSEVIFAGINPPKMGSVRFLCLSHWWR